MANKDYNEEVFKQTVGEVKEAIHKCDCTSYENVYFISKSLAQLLQEKFFGNSTVSM